jgi:hypothetical protein
MRTVTGLFDTHDRAKDAVAALEDAGIPSGEISLISPDRDDSDNTAAGAGIGIGASVLRSVVPVGSWPVWVHSPYPVSGP